MVVEQFIGTVGQGSVSECPRYSTWGDRRFGSLRREPTRSARLVEFIEVSAGSVGWSVRHRRRDPVAGGRQSSGEMTAIEVDLRFVLVAEVINVGDQLAMTRLVHAGPDGRCQCWGTG